MLAELLNNREIAVLLWGAVFVLWIVLKVKLGDETKALIRAFLATKVAVPFMLMTALSAERPVQVPACSVAG